MKECFNSPHYEQNMNKAYREHERWGKLKEEFHAADKSKHAKHNGVEGASVRQDDAGSTS